MPLSYTGKGLRYWIESAGIYAAKAWSKLEPKTTDANADAVISPKGNGALLAQVPDGTVAGGNARGLYAIDLQRERVDPTQVASGDYSNILSGGANKASGIASQVFSGFNNEATNYGAAVVTGWANKATGIYSTIYAGVGNQVSGLDSLICHGRWGIVNGANSFMGYAGSSANGTGDGTVAPVGNTGNRIEGSMNVLVGGINNAIGYDGTTVYGTNTSFLGGGELNKIYGRNSVICGGVSNRCDGSWSVVVGGYSNQLLQELASTVKTYCTLVGGWQNKIKDSRGAFIGGGANNEIVALNVAGQLTDGCYQSVIVGGHLNKIGNGANVAYAAIGGGYANSVLSNYSGVFSGKYNSVTGGGTASVVAGGELNTCNNSFAGVLTGRNNSANASYAVVIGGGSAAAGEGNLAISSHSLIGNGLAHYVYAARSTVLNGTRNIIEWNMQDGVICGGNNNLLDGGASQYTFIGNGLGNQVKHGGDRTTTGAVGSSILNGAYNTITGNYSVICGGGTGTAGQGNTISGLNGFIGNGVGNTLGTGYLNTILNGSGISITSSNSVVVLGNYRTDPTQNNSLTVSGSAESVIHQGWGGINTTYAGLSASVFMCNQSGSSSVVVRGVHLANNASSQSNTSFCVSMSGQFSSVSTAAFSTQIGTQSSNINNANYSGMFNSLNSTITHDFSTICNGSFVTTRTHHSQATGYIKAQRHVSDFLYQGITTANETVTAIAIPSSGVLTKDAKSVLTIPFNSVMVGKLNFSVKEAATANVLAWIDAQVTIYKGASTPVITINKVDTVGSITGVTLAVVNSGTVANGIEFQITSVEIKTLRAKATFEYDLITD